MSGPSAKSDTIMRVLRAELGLDLKSAKTVVRRVVSGDYSGTLPKVEHLAASCGSPASLL
ncbi:hypothetical protein K2224_33890 (plasmid) [Streptomyces sp. BHT-5-2]|uniref:hypothetical protein n=1 Tax=Streptomyces sp. BHT-5-2 TaxID=2866715 RepID=UPI001C8E47A1|nr:hypothetical protein [Streptomyces sp. BHT-5-2]QZL08139.1 hypothetical protein K2224_33890 [Streptomyces sp. BHT-5-2]